MMRLHLSKRTSGGKEAKCAFVPEACFGMEKGLKGFGPKDNNRE